ncbi:hypothetical protein KP509_03G014900 [Ceratopteris richardii]|uniref:Tetratricopeptide repeat protein n=1 Tax=Ceratopteris richardii TaxID=49495 RepID=A0A8T2V469_CERRI|nr:hypothetical protein KP509_03G014900 [Ceratopteris richardii]
MTGHILISKWSACFPSRGVPRQWISSLRYRGFFLHPIRKAECCTLTLASTAIVRLRQSTFLPPLLAYQQVARMTELKTIYGNVCSCYRGMGLCYASLNESESALYWFEKAISIHPGLGQINKFIKMLKQKLSELNNDKDKDANKDNSEQDT